MVALNENARRAVGAGRLGHLVTVNEDGSPQASVVWIGLDGANEYGLGHYLIVNATATLVEGGAPELLQRLAEVYLGPSVRFPDFDTPPGHVIRLRVQSVGGVGPWSE